MENRKNFVLITLEDRTVDSLRFYETHTEAYNVMLSEFAFYLQKDITEIDEDDTDGNYGFLNDDSAWISTYSDITWSIKNLDEERPRDAKRRGE